MSPSTPPSIPNPLRVLVLTTSTSTPLPPLLQGSDLPLRTSYYSTINPIWHDTISSLSAWEQEWLAPEAGEVIRSIGAWAVAVRKPAVSSTRGENRQDEVESLESIRATLTTLHRVLNHHRSSSSYTSNAPLDTSPLLLALGMPQPLRPLLAVSDDEWEDLCRDAGGWEWIDSEATGRNEYGEKVGLARLKEALEANEWDGEEVEADDLEAQLGLREQNKEKEEAEDAVTPAGVDFGGDYDGMHEAILRHGDGGEGDEDDMQVEELESMMLKMQAIKEKGASMPEEERKRFAAKAVTEVMKSVKSVR